MVCVYHFPKSTDAVLLYLWEGRRLHVCATVKQMASDFTKALKPRPSPPTEIKPKTKTAGELKPAHTTLFSSRFVKVLHIRDQNQQLFTSHRCRPLFAPHSLLAGFAGTVLCPRHEVLGWNMFSTPIMAWSNTPIPLFPFWNTKGTRHQWKCNSCQLHSPAGVLKQMSSGRENENDSKSSNP